MSISNIVTRQVAENVKADVLGKLNNARQMLKPFYITLSDNQKRQLVKAGGGSQAFLEKSIDYAKTNPDFLPRFVDEQELNNDFLAYRAIREVERNLLRLVAEINDLSIDSGSDTFIALLAYYNSAKRAAAMGNSEAKAIVEDLGSRFNNGASADNGDEAGA